jgi:UDP-N-acetyl-D-glucosamine/UDP-N-acetyl-D-galactosamine dehydrogenase
MMDDLQNISIAVIGLGYVGLPLALEFSKQFQTIGFDIDQTRITELNAGIDRTNEVCSRDLLNSSLHVTGDNKFLKNCNIYLVTVPTPIDEHKRPDLTPVIEATNIVAQQLKINDFVIYESTGYPGMTEEICVPILENISGLSLNKEFYVGYSPERINPGDKSRTVTDIQKVTSGSNGFASDFIDKLYKRIINAGTYRATSIKVAEAAKVIENTQRDVNIALINELSIIFNKLGIDTKEVLEAAETKWNFLSFRPGLVGGHCIGVDPYYLTHKALALGYNPEIILAGRRLNDRMPEYCAERFVKAMISKDINLKHARVLILGMTFKENCPDIRNSKVFNLHDSLSSYSICAEFYDPHVSKEHVEAYYREHIVDELEENTYDGVIVAVGHDIFRNDVTKKLNFICKQERVLFDLKYVLDASDVDLRM